MPQNIRISADLILTAPDGSPTRSPTCWDCKGPPTVTQLEEVLTR